MKLRDYWIPAVGLALLAVGLLYLIACKLFPKNFKPTVEPININASQISAGTLHPRDARGRFKPRA